MADLSPKVCAAKIFVRSLLLRQRFLTRVRKGKHRLEADFSCAEHQGPEWAVSDVDA